MIDERTAEAIEAVLKGRKCNVCTGWSPSWDGHDKNPPCMGHGLDVLKQKLAEYKAYEKRIDG